MTLQRPGCLSSIFGSPRWKTRDSDNAVEFDEPKELPYRLRDDFLSDSEASFYHVLKTMLGDRLMICPKVSLAELFYVSRGSDYQTHLNKIDRKRVDFLLCDPKTLKPVLAIELDDPSHQRLDRQERDEFVEEVFHVAKLPILRIPARQSYNTQELALLFKTAINKNQAEKKSEPQPSVDPSDPPLCPKCGSRMVLRTAKRGATPGQQFFGCPNYPRCKIVIPIKSL